MTGIREMLRRRLGVPELETKLANVSSRRDKAEAALSESRAALKELRGRYQAQGDNLRDSRASLAVLRADREAMLDLLSGRTGLPAEVTRVLVHVLAERLTMIKARGLIEMCEVVSDLRERGVAGSFLETGTALGGSAILLAAAKEPDRELAVYDVFGQIPPPTEQDGDDVHARYETIARGEAQGMGEDRYYGYQEDLLGKVTAAFATAGYPVGDHRVRLVQGLFEDTLHPDGPVAFAHLDGDWYESTMVSLKRVVPHVSLGGVLMIDDYNSWSGCAKAVDEFFADREDFERVEGDRLRLVRTAV